MSRPKDLWHDFVVLPENQLAEHAVRRLVHSVRKSVRIVSELVVLHGPTGCGKSALVAAATRELGSQALIIPAKDLTRLTDIVDALLIPFLVIEDIQFVSGEAAERLVTILDSRAARRKATLVTSSQAPAELKSLPNRLTNRLAGGLVIAFPPLSEASRANMLVRLAKRMQSPLTRKKARQIAAGQLGSVRPLIGAIQTTQRRHRVPAASAISRLDDVSARVAKAMGTTVEELRGPAQFRSISTARQVVARLAYDHYRVNYRQIEQYLNRSGLAMAGTHLDMKLLRDAKLKLLFERLEEECRGRIDQE